MADQVDIPVPRDARTGGTPVARWQLAALCAILALVATVAGGVLDTSRPLTFGHDLLPSYVAGLLVREGGGGQLYDAATVEGAGRRVIADANLTNDPRHVRWINPAYFAPVFAPLSALPYRWAIVVWTTANVALFGAALATLLRLLPPVPRLRAAVAAAVVASCPFVLAFEHGQNTFLSLAILTGVVAAWRAGRGMSAGLLVGLLAYKPQLAAAVGVAVALSLGWRAAAGLLVAGVSCLLIGEAVSPGSAVAFVRTVPATVAVFHHDPTFAWGRQVTPTGFFRALLGPASPVAAALGTAASAAVVAAVAWAAWRARCSGPAARDRLIVAAVTALPLSAPYFMDYDLLLLAVPAALTLAVDRRPATIAMWVALWMVAYANVDLVRATGVNAVVVVLGVAGVASLRHVVREDADEAPAGLAEGKDTLAVRQRPAIALTSTV